jgi:hypothetical protein
MCNNSTPSPTALTGGLAGYLLTDGYDLATGWGSIDINNLLYALSPGFSITAAPSTLSLSAGATSGNSATLTYTSLGSFSGVITQSCTVTFTGSGTPSLVPTCSFTASTVTLPANGVVTGTIAIASTAPGGSASVVRPTLPTLALFALLFGLLPGRRRHLNFVRSLAICSAIAMAAASLSGCGGGSSSSTSTSPAPSSTPGTYTISLTSSSGVTSATPSANISLIIH